MTTPRLSGYSTYGKVESPTREPRRSRRSRTSGSVEVGPANRFAMNNTGTSRAANARMLQASAAEFGEPEGLDVTDEEIMGLRAYWTDPAIREIAGLSEDVDVSKIGNNPAWLKAMNPDANKRLRRAVEFMKSPEMLRAARQPTPQPKPADPRNAKSNEQKAMEMLARQGYGGSELEGDLPMPDWAPEGMRTATDRASFLELLGGGPGPKPQPDPKNPRISPAFFAKAVGTGMLTGLGKAMEPLDVFAETTAELGAQVPKLGGPTFSPKDLIAGKQPFGFDMPDVEAPTLFTEGYGAALEDFEARPLSEQLLLSVLDPTIIFGGGKLTARMLTGSLGKITIEQTLEGKARAVARKELEKLKKSGQISSMIISPDNQSILASALRTTTADTAKKSFIDRVPGANRARLAGDPSSEIRRLPVGSPKRVGLETSLLHKRLGIMHDAFTEVIMSGIREKGSLKDLFGVADGFGEDAIRAPKVTVKTVPDVVTNLGTEIKEALSNFVLRGEGGSLDLQIREGIGMGTYVEKLSRASKAMKELTTVPTIRSSKAAMEEVQQLFNIVRDIKIEFGGEIRSKRMKLNLEDPKSVERFLDDIARTIERTESKSEAAFHRRQIFSGKPHDLDDPADMARYLEELRQASEEAQIALGKKTRDPSDIEFEKWKTGQLIDPARITKLTDKMDSSLTRINKILAKESGLIDEVLSPINLKSVEQEFEGIKHTLPKFKQKTVMMAITHARKWMKRIKEIERLPATTAEHLDEVKGYLNKEIDSIYYYMGKTRPEPLKQEVYKGKVPFFGNVFERPGNYNLTTDQRKWIDDVHKILDEALVYFKTEGVNVDELGKLDDEFFFFPRRVRDEISGKMNVEFGDVRTGGTRIGKPRLNELMDDTIRGKGKRYEGPYEALNSYFRGGYNEVARVRAQNHAGPLFREQTVSEELLTRKKAATHINSVQERSVRDVGNMLQGFLPGTATIAAMKRGFPTLADAITTVTSFKPVDLSDAIRKVGEETLEATKLTAEQIREILTNIPVIDPESLGRPLDKPGQSSFDRLTSRISDTPLTPEEFRNLNIDPSDISDPGLMPQIDRMSQGRMSEEGARTTRKQLGLEDAVKALVRAGVERESAGKLIEEAAKQSFKVASGIQTEAIKALRERMIELRGPMLGQFNPRGEWITGELERSREAVKRARTRATSPTASEERSAFFPNQIYKDHPGLDGELMTSGQSIAVDLEKRMFDRGEGIWKGASSVNAILRSIKTVTDFGAPFIQGLPMLMRDPAAWGQATTAHLVAFANPRVRSRYISGNAQDIVDMISHGGQLGSSEFTEAMMQGGFLAKLPLMIDDAPVPLGPARPVGRKSASIVYATANRFGNSFETFLDMARIETWKSLRHSAKNSSELDELASFVNKFTGTTSSRALGVSLTQQQFESAIPFFSPRYVRATSSLMMDAFRGGLKGDQARHSMASIFLGASAFHVAAQTAMGQPIHLDPTKPGEFMRTDLFGQRIGPGGKFLSYLKAFVKMSAQAITRPEDFLEWNVLNTEDYKDNQALSFLRNQSSIVAGSVISFATGADPLGKSMPGLTDAKAMAGTFLREGLPFSLDAALEANSIPGALAAGISEFVGLTAFETPPFVKMNDLFKKYSQEDFGMSYEDLERTDDAGRSRKRQLIANHPDLKAAYDLSADELRGRKLTRDRMLVRDKMDGFTQDWVDAGKQAGENYRNDVERWDPSAARNLRIALRDAGRTRRDKRSVVEEQFPEVFADLELYYAEQSAELMEEHGHTFLIAQQEFYDKLSSDAIIDTSTGKTDYVAIDNLRRDIDDEFGAGTMARIDKEQQDKDFEKDLDPIHKAFIKSHETLRPYWEAYKTVLPEDEWQAWRGYDLLPEAQKRVFGQRFAEQEALVVMARHEMKSSSVEIDKALFQIYGFKPTNPQFIKGLVEDMQKDLTNTP